MSNVTTIQNGFQAIEKVILQGDISVLSPQQKVEYCTKVCEMLGLNPLTKPFEFMRLNGKEVMYATKGCAEQLRSIHKIGLKIVDKQKIDDVYVVTAEALDPNGRTDSATGAVNVAGIKGEALANAMMKAETKAKRRVTLSICGLNMLDETEVDSIPGVEKTGNPYAMKNFQPADDEGDPFAITEYKIPFGTIKNKTLMEVLRTLGPEPLKKAVDATEARIEEGKPYAGVTIEQMQDFVTRAVEIIVKLECGELDVSESPKGFVVK